MDILTIIILALAVYQLTRLFHVEDGPLNMFGKLRKFIGISYDERSNRVANNQIAKAFNCPRCLGLWVGFAVWGGYALWTPLLFWLYIPLALSAINTLLFLRFGSE